MRERDGVDEPNQGTLQGYAEMSQGIPSVQLICTNKIC
jgi:hypothetical protein